MFVKLSFFNFKRIVYETDSSTDARSTQDSKDNVCSSNLFIISYGQLQNPAIIIQFTRNNILTIKSYVASSGFLIHNRGVYRDTILEIFSGCLAYNSFWKTAKPSILIQIKNSVH